MASVVSSPGVRAKRWTKAEYYRLGELGFFQGQRVELIEGRLMVHCPQGPLHSDVLDGVVETLRDAFGRSYRVRCQLPVNLNQTTEPEPDVLVVQGTRGQFRNGHPTSALLIVEVSDTTLAYDRGRKGSLYARAGIADYWVVNLVNRQVEVSRDPMPDPAEPYGHRYGTRIDLVSPGTVSPLALPGAALAVADLLG